MQLDISENEAPEIDPVEAMLGMGEAATGAAEGQEPEAPVVDDSERRQVLKFLMDTKAPQWLERAFRRWKTEREYIHTTIFAEDEPDKLTVNTLLRSIYAKLSQVWPENPEAVVKPADEVEPPLDHPARPLWEAYRLELEQIGKTAAVCHRKWTKDSSMIPTMRKAAISTFTVGLNWLKTGWEEDTNRGALGQSVRHAGTGRDQLLTLRRLSQEFHRGDFDRDCEDYQKLMDLSGWMKQAATKKLQALTMGDPREARLAAIVATPADQPVVPWVLPEPDVWMAPIVDVIDPEDVRFDWNRVTSPSLCHRGRWWNHRVWMHRDEVATRFRITKEEKLKLGQTSEWLQRSSKNAMLGIYGEHREDPRDAELEAQTRANGQEIAVWERTDLETGMMYWFCAGIDHHLDKQVIELTTKRGHPFIPVFFNEVDGRFEPVSDTAFGRKVQDNLNQTLTDDWEARIAAYPFYAIASGILSKEDMQAIEHGRRAHKVVELTKPSEDVAKAIQSIKGEEYHPERYQIAVSQMNALMERMVGAPVEAQGGQGKPEFATQLALMQQSMNVAAGRVAKLLIEMMTQVYEDWTDYALVAMPEKHAKTLAGPFAAWPVVSRPQIRSAMVVEIITAGIRGQRQADLQDLQAATGVINQALNTEALAKQLGYTFDSVPFASRVCATMDLRIAGGLLRKQPQLPMAQAVPGTVPPGSQGGMVPGPAAGPGNASAPASSGAPATSALGPLQQLLNAR
jgi:hypothetical protein